ncbi:hypothetical protein ACLM5J_02545 [Nocardioides sp. Bht2]|uniref:hypothetical protein n=1 Tax=Nocardioides sp. Bht2 TaxID=3392297 RepID=UPI0039B43462
MRRLRMLLATAVVAGAGIVALPAPANAGQVLVTIGIKGSGTVRVVEGSLEDGGSAFCDQSQNLDHRVTLSCARVRNEEPLEAWVWLRPSTSSSPAFWSFVDWQGCDQTRERSGIKECGVGSSAFGTSNKAPVAIFRDNSAPAVTELTADQVTTQDGTFRFTWKGNDSVGEKCRFGAAEFTACSSGHTATLPEGHYTFSVRAEDASGNLSVVEQTVVSSVETTLFIRPPAVSTSRAAEFFYSGTNGAEFDCTLDAVAVACSAEGVIRFANLSDGGHTFTVRSREGAWVDASPSTWSWRVDTTAPQTTLTGAPVSGSVLLSRAATFGVSTDDPLAEIECSLDGVERDCAGGTPAFAGLASGTHEFAATAVDQAGNRDSSPALTHWTVPFAAPNFKRSKGWRLIRTSSAYDGTALTTKKRKTSLTLSVRGARSLVLVAGRSKKNGTVAIYAGSRLIKKVSLNGSKSLGKQLIKVASFATPYSGTVRIKVLTNKRPVRIEGLAAPTR